jgi:hypothetical protein
VVKGTGTGVDRLENGAGTGAERTRAGVEGVGNGAETGVERGGAGRGWRGWERG